MLERLIRSLFQRMGILIRYYSPSSSEDFRRTLLFKYHHIDTVLDIGANKGQYATGLIAASYTGNITSYKPLSSAHASITKLSKSYPNWVVAERCAIGAEAGEVDINITANSVSSTLLTMLDSHLSGAPDSKVIAIEKTPLKTLDSLAYEQVKDKSVFLKIDVQGYEQEVLKGASSLLKIAKGIEMEISLIPSYAGQHWLFEEVISFMKKEGFELESITPAFTDHQTGKVLQCNDIFFRN